MRRRGWRSASPTGRIEALGWRGAAGGGVDGEVVDVVVEDSKAGGGAAGVGAGCGVCDAEPGAGVNLDDAGGGAYDGCCRGWKNDFMED